MIASILVLSLTGLNDFGVKPVQATVTMFPSDGDAWTENDNVTHPWTPYYEDDTMSWDTTEAQNGSYCIMWNHISTNVKPRFKLNINGVHDCSDYDVLVFYIKCVWYKSAVKGFDVRMGDGGSNYIHYDVKPSNASWTKSVLPLDGCKTVNSGSSSSIEYVVFWGDTITAQSYSLVYVDGIHFRDYEDPTTETVDYTFQPNYFAYYPKYCEKTITFQGTAYTSLYDFSYINGNPSQGTLESECLGQTIFALSTTYLESGDSYPISKAEEYATWLRQFVLNNTYGAVAYYFTDGTDTFSSTVSTTVTGWCLAGWSKLYGATSNETWKDCADRMRSFHTDVMWNAAEEQLHQTFNIDTGTASGTAQSMSLGSTLCGLASYYRYVEHNATVKSIALKIYDNIVLHERNNYGYNTWENSYYCYWGIWEGWHAFQNSTLETKFPNGIKMLRSWAMMTNGSVWYYGSKYHSSESIGDIDGWGNALQIPLSILYYKNSSEDYALTMFNYYMWTWVKNIRSSIGAFYFRSSNPNRMWNPTMAFIYLALSVYNDFMTDDPYPLTTTQKVESYVYESTWITINVNGSTGETSVTRIYCANEGKPRSVIGATDWTYDSSLKILEVEVYHASTKIVIIMWGSSVGGYARAFEFKSPPRTYAFPLVVFLIFAVFLLLKRK